MKRLVLCLATVVLCSGQMCGAPLPDPQPQPSASGDSVASPTLSAPPIAEGLYTGLVTWRARTYAGGALYFDDTAVVTDGVIIGPNGLPIGKDNQPLDVGHKSTIVTGDDRTLDLTITGIRTTGSSIIVNFRAQESFTTDDGQPVSADGQAVEILTLRSDGQLDYSIQLTTYATIYGVDTTVQREWTGVLSRQSA